MSTQSQLLLIILCLLTQLQYWPLKAEESRTEIEKLSVFGKKELLPTRPGSAHIISEKDLKTFDFSDIHQVLRSVPGVNVQEEDGFGLRPNIGLRGGHPHRSKKVAILEDGVLIGPAPYSAPAAYYFPQLSKIGSIEVFKGAPSTTFGPNNIGGAINLVTKENDPGVGFGLKQGLFSSREYKISLGVETWGHISADFSRAETDGFKELDSQQNTGFTRNNATLKWDKSFATYDQNIKLKYNWSDEISNETYAGLTDADFAQNPLLRYPSTALDKMDWTHRQYFASYAISPVDNLRARTTLYRHQFARSWDKLIGFAGTNPSNPSPTLSNVLNNPDFVEYNYYYQVLSGQTNSGVLTDNRDVLEVGDNQRQYLSQGVQTQLDYTIEGYSWDHNFSLGYRVHQDQVDRLHESRFFNMTDGQLALNQSRPQTLTALNNGSTLAQTWSASYEAQVNDLTINTAFRYEDIAYDYDDSMKEVQQKSDDHIFAPGFGLYHQTFQNTGLIFGVNKAFTTVGPGQAPNINPEESINYEFGLRHTGLIGAELIGFYSDYSNILGTCTQSGGCQIDQLDQSFNGGEAEVLGLEMMVSGEIKRRDMSFPIQLTATYTQAQFKNTFTSGLSDWGIGLITSGDPIPYIPDWQAQMVMGWDYKNWRTSIRANYLGKMADQSVALGRTDIPSRMIFGAALAYQWRQNTQFKLRLDNITNERYAVSRRPFGLRPGLPFMAFLGVESAFF